MALPDPKERRRNPRKRFSGLMPGRMIDTESGKDVNCRPVDINTYGLGLIISEQFKPGHRLRLVTPDTEVLLKVIWVRPDFGKQDLFRYGLVSVEKNVDLIDLFTKAGCLR